MATDMPYNPEPTSFEKEIAEAKGSDDEDEEISSKQSQTPIKGSTLEDMLSRDLNNVLVKESELFAKQMSQIKNKF